jgi:UDP-glucose 4-epimerase
MNKKKKTILVTGGAGFVGSYVNRALQRHGFSTVVVDDLSRGKQESISGAPLVVGDVGDGDVLDRIFTNTPIHAVLHFAGSISVGESFLVPSHYYRNNVINTLTLLEKMLQYQVKKIVFSSSAAVYGIAQ